MVLRSAGVMCGNAVPRSEWVQRARSACAAPHLVAWLLIAVGCSSPPTARDTLVPATVPPIEVEPKAHFAADAPLIDAGPAGVRAAATRALESTRSAALVLLERAEAAPLDPAASARAARALSDVADLTLLAAQVARFHAQPADEPGALVRGEDNLDAAVKREVEGLVRDAARLARAAIDVAADAATTIRPDAPTEDGATVTPREFDTLGAHQDEAFAESLTAWAIGPTRALVSGAGRRLPKLLAANCALGAEREGAAPLRLEGRFLCLAPWPVGDRERGRELLDAAVAAAPTPLNALFQGDAAWLAQEPAAAQRAWQLARAAAEAAPAHDTHAVLVGELARMRLAALVQ